MEIQGEKYIVLILKSCIFWEEGLHYSFFDNDRKKWMIFLLYLYKIRQEEIDLIENSLSMISNQLVIFPIPSDGNCLFRSVAHQCALKNINLNEKLVHLRDQIEEDEKVELFDQKLNKLNDEGKQRKEEDDHEKMRFGCVETMKLFSEEFENFVVLYEEDEEDVEGVQNSSSNLSKYCHKMSQSFIWGGDVEIRAMSLFLQVFFRIIALIF